MHCVLIINQYFRTEVNFLHYLICVNEHSYFFKLLLVMHFKVLPFSGNWPKKLFFPLLLVTPKAKNYYYVVDLSNVSFVSVSKQNR